MRGKTMKDKSKKSTYSTTFGIDPIFKVARKDMGIRAVLEFGGR